MTENAQLTVDQIRMSIQELVASVTERETGEVAADARFKEDLGVDSLLGIELMLLIDKKFGIEIPDEEFEQLLTVNEAVPVVQRYLAEGTLPRGA
jgi:acyl carrier protein